MNKRNENPRRKTRVSHISHMSHINPFARKALCLITTLLCSSALSSAPLEVSGVYPHLATSNREGECGTGAVVPWADRLWVISYGPHLPFGSSDKLYEITPDLEKIIRPESVGGTPANRMIHRESNQLVIGPYWIDAQRNVRVIPPARMFGRLTGTARHLSEPGRKVYVATMEEGLYEVDVDTLEVTPLIRDGNLGANANGANGVKGGKYADKVTPQTLDAIPSELPGYHGKGLYSGQGKLVYSNNGEHGDRALKDPTTASGALGWWNGSGDWQLVRRNQFTEVTGPGGIEGNANPETDPVWAMGWDAKSLLLMLLEKGHWHAYRLPKASHSYDGAHGWNTEWPRIRDIGETDLLMTMHGALWRFPRDFSRARSGGIAPISNYLRVIGDFALWQGRVVFGCDDSAKSEFLNKRSFKNEHATPPQSNSNLWFVEPKQLASFGPAIGRGSVWLREDVSANAESEPFLFSGFDLRMLHLIHDSKHPVRVRIETDAEGNNVWQTQSVITVPAGGNVNHNFSSTLSAAWIRLVAEDPASALSASFHFRNRDPRKIPNGKLFDGFAPIHSKTKTSGDKIEAAGARPAHLRSLGADKIGLSVPGGGFYEMDSSMQLCESKSAERRALVDQGAPIEVQTISADAASILIEEDGKRYRLPRGAVLDGGLGAPRKSRMEARAGAVTGPARVCREVATERDLLNTGGTFFELPARNAQGIAKIRPIATHNLAIHDYASQFGLMFISGAIAPEAAAAKHVFTSADGAVCVWVGVIDDLWQLGKPRGLGGPWKNTSVKAGEPSDPYLMSGYDRKEVTLSHKAGGALHIRLEVDIDGTGLWVPYGRFLVPAGKEIRHTFDEAFGAYWIRAVSENDCDATVQLRYQ